MIDSIKITLDNFSGSLENCKPTEIRPDPETGALYENFLLPNEKRTARHSLKLHRQLGSRKLYVEGSVRKWLNNRDTLVDLTAASFEHTMKLLAPKLNISFDELCRAEFTQCEIGMNIRTDIPCSEIIPLIVRYGQFTVDPKKSVPWQTSYFMGSAKNLKIYDKGKEVGDHARSAKNIRMRKEAMEILKKKSYHFLRIEYTLPNKKAFNQHRMNHIKTIGDLINNYASLYEFWSRESSRIVLLNRIDESRKMKKADLKRAMNLNLCGFEEAMRLNAAGINRNNPNKRSVSAAMSASLKKILTVIKKYSSKEDYNINSFRRDITREFMRKWRKDPIFDIHSGIRALWQIRNGKEKVKSK